MDINHDYPGKEFDDQWKQFVFPKNYVNPEPKSRYHLVVIGAGPAGLITAIAAAGLGAKVALIEKNAMGGDCLNVGCVPSKALIHQAKISKCMGEDTQNAHLSPLLFSQAMSWVREVRFDISEHDSVKRYTEAGVDVFLGDAKYADEQTIVVGDKQLNTKKSVICTGARASVIPFEGLEDTGYLTNENVFDIKDRPESIALIGAGPIGCELAQAFNRLGTKVYLLDAASRILPREDIRASEILSEVLLEEGVVVKTGANIQKVFKTDSKKAISFDNNETIEIDEIVCALGRLPNIEGLELDKIGVETDPRAGIKVNDKLQTSNPKIYAAGDICSLYKFTHNADAQARIVVQNALFMGRAKTNNMVIPWCTYTDPEVAHVGLTKVDAKKQQINCEAIIVNLSDLDRSKTDNKHIGYAEVLIGKKGKILGATIVGEGAGELLAPITILMSNNLGIRALDKSIMPYPTRSEYLKRIADEYNRKKLTPLVSKIFRIWFKLTG
ncbi:MAG: mercuric reductase [Gammaproteobacteria bacterium]|nr:MAG: mercuric reductase [Gammaproteobacteria bacterium]